MMRMSAGLAQSAIERGLPLHAAIYGRVSKDPSNRQKSVEDQEADNRAVCVQNSWLLTEQDVYVDNDKSASRFATKDRPDWRRLRQSVATHLYHVVVLWEVSRGDRDDLGWLGFLHECRKIGVLIHITSHGHTYDVRKRRDYKTLAEEGLDSADESERTSERIRRDVESTARKGLPHSATPYGYRREYELDERGHRYMVGQFPDEAPRVARAVDGSEVVYSPAGVIRELVRRLLAGETAWGIAADLNERGIPTPQDSALGWMDSTVRTRAISPTYAGLRVHRGKVIGDAAWPGLVSKGDHYTLVARLSDPARRTQRDSKIKYLGSGLFVCGVCHRLARVTKRDYGRAYYCAPTRVVSQSKRKARPATDAEIEALRGLDIDVMASKVLDFYESGVTLASIARGLGIHRATLGMRVITERKRRGYPEQQKKDPSETTNHFSRNIEVVDGYVERAMWLRLARPDIADLLAGDERADERLAVLNTEIAEKQARLEAARDSYASGREGSLSLEALERIEARLGPEITQARARLNEARIGPVLRGLLLPSVEEIRAEWYRRDLSQRRAVIRVLTERVEIRPIGRGRRVVPPDQQVQIVWREPSREA
jgi:DNA invertase Pin-like site-specific DNA recombinase